jgi:hypothetical protein
MLPAVTAPNILPSSPVFTEILRSNLPMEAATSVIEFRSAARVGTALTQRLEMLVGGIERWRDGVEQVIAA